MAIYLAYLVYEGVNRTECRWEGEKRLYSEQPFALNKDLLKLQKQVERLQAIIDGGDGRSTDSNRTNFLPEPSVPSYPTIETEEEVESDTEHAAVAVSFVWHIYQIED